MSYLWSTTKSRSYSAAFFIAALAFALFLLIPSVPLAEENTAESITVDATTKATTTASTDSEEISEEQKSEGENVAAPAPKIPRAHGFEEPEELESAIVFWVSIFTEYDRHEAVLHDRDHMNIIYGTFTLPLAKNGKPDLRAGRKVATQKVAELEKRLHHLRKGNTPRDEEDSRLLGILGGPDSELLKQAPYRIRWQRGVANAFRDGLKRSEKWRSDIYDILDESGVPRELAALPFVESMFNPYARSSAGAAGLWQLMPATARGLGLKVSSKNDERLEPLKATRAAARMLKQNHKMLGSWPLALTAYNHGPNGVRRAVKSVGSSDLMELIKHCKKKSFGFASKNFYAEFLAVLRILPEFNQQAAEVQISQNESHSEDTNEIDALSVF